MLDARYRYWTAWTAAGLLASWSLTILSTGLHSDILGWETRFHQ